MDFMWSVCLFLVQVAICVAILDVIFQLLKDFVPSGKTIFGVFAIIAGVIGLKNLKKYFDEKNKKIIEGESIPNEKETK